MTIIMIFPHAREEGEKERIYAHAHSCTMQRARDRLLEGGREGGKHERMEVERKGKREGESKKEGGGEEERAKD